jgi:hypothetical protein
MLERRFSLGSLLDHVVILTVKKRLPGKSAREPRCPFYDAKETSFPDIRPMLLKLLIAVHGGRTWDGDMAR